MDNCDLTTLPIDSTDFEELRKLNQIYVDKTDLIFEMVKFHAPIFLSRPRRFGKSLLTTTIKSLCLICLHQRRSTLSHQNTLLFYSIQPFLCMYRYTYLAYFCACICHHFYIAIN